jgi:hypothetical protein
MKRSNNGCHDGLFSKRREKDETFWKVYVDMNWYGYVLCTLTEDGQSTLLHTLGTLGACGLRQSKVVKGDTHTDTQKVSYSHKCTFIFQNNENILKIVADWN